jgi:tRNA (cmo5U34)-methyltransferase
MSDETFTNGWDEETSLHFIDYGRYFVPERERQNQMMVGLIPPVDRPSVIVELCCGEGLLAEALLERYPAVTVYGLDGSQEMLKHARQRLERFGERFQGVVFDLADSSWRNFSFTPRAVVSSLAIHHLDGPQKQALFRDVYRMLAEGGAFIVADIIEPAGETGRRLAAGGWDEVVRQRSLELDGNTAVFDSFDGQKWNTYRYPDPEDYDKPSRLFEMLKWLEQAGFGEVDVYWMRAGHALYGARKV